MKTMETNGSEEGGRRSLMEVVNSLKGKSLAYRILLNKYFIATMLFLIWIIFIDNNNVGHWIRTNRKLREQEQQIENLKNDIRRTEDRLNQLQSQKDSLERFARENYLFHEEGEDVYVVRKVDGND